MEANAIWASAAQRRREGGVVACVTTVLVVPTVQLCAWCPAGFVLASLPAVIKTSSDVANVSKAGGGTVDGP